MSEKPVIAAIDVGSGYTKWAVRDARGQLRTGAFISSAPPAMRSGHGEDHHSTACVTVDGVVHIVGPGCLTYCDPLMEIRGAAWSPDRTTYEALVLYALASIDERVIHHLVLGHAPESNLTDLSMYQGDVAVPVLADRGTTTRVTSVRLVSIVSPTAAALLGAAVHEPALLEHAGQTLVLQLGYSSLLFQAPDGAYTPAGTVMGGMFRVYEQLNRRFGFDSCSYARIPHVRFELAQTEAKPVWWSARYHDFNGELPTALPLLDVYLAEAMRRMGPLPLLHNVVVTGGAAPLLAKRFMRRYPDLPAPYVAPQPQYASVKGYLASAQAADLGIPPPSELRNKKRKDSSAARTV